MQNNNSKLKTDLKRRAYFYALEIIKFINAKDKANKLLQETAELANILGASILTLKGKKKL